MAAAATPVSADYVAQSECGSTARTRRLRQKYFATRPRLCIERALAFTESYRQTEGEPTVIRRAKAFRQACRTTTVAIGDGELIVGNPGSGPRTACVYPDIAWQWVERELDDLPKRGQDPYLVTDEHKRLLRERVFPYWKGRSVQEHCIAALPEETRNLVVDRGLIDNEIKQINGIGHFCPGYANRVLPFGLRGIMREAKETASALDAAIPGELEKLEFLQAVAITCQSVIDLAGRYADRAEHLAGETPDEVRRAELGVIADTCRRVPAEAPRTFGEALQSIWFCQVAMYIETNGPGVSWGRFDQYMAPYYEADLAAGRLDRERALELLECLWIKNSELIWIQNGNTAKFFAGYSPFQNMCIGGRRDDGTDGTNEVSYLCLAATKSVRLNQPSLSVKVHPQTPDGFLVAIADLVREGLGFPAIHSDEVGEKMMLSRGASPDDARDWCVMGCVEPLVPGKTMKYSDGGEYNMGAAMEWALTSGLSRIYGERLGVETGDPESFHTFDDVMRATKTQLAHLIRHLVIANQVAERVHRTLLPVPFSSSTVAGCVAAGIDMTAGGAQYNDGPGFLGVGIADVGNSLAAIKKLVYEDGALSMVDLLNALDADFAGYEQVRALLLNRAPKWGNDDELVDGLVCEVADFYASEIGKYQGPRGCSFISALFPVSSNTPLGMVVGALPSGRHAGTPLADGVSPQQGTDSSPTAVLKSVSQLHHELHCNGTLLNLKLTPALLEGERGLRNLASLVRGYIELGGYHVQFNVVSADTLRQAQEDPESYTGLMVRVAGYSAYFNDLCREIQDDIISRTEHCRF